MREYASEQLATANELAAALARHLDHFATVGILMDHNRAAARELLESALAIGNAAQDRWSQNQANLYLGILAESSAEPQAASSLFRKAVACLQPDLQPDRDSTLLPVALIGQAGLIARRDPATALKVVAAAWAVRA